MPNQTADTQETGHIGKLLLADEVADILRMSPATLSGWRSKRNPGLSYVTWGTSPRYRPEDVRRFIDDHVVAAPTTKVRRQKPSR